MASISKHISAIRILIKQNQDDTDYSDEFLYHLLNNAKATLLSRRIYKWHQLSKWNYQTFCAELVKGKAHDCDCVREGCTVLKTKYKIPEALKGRNRSLIKIFDLNNKEIPLVDEQTIRDSVYDDIKKDQTLAALINKRIVIFNNLNLRIIQIKGIWYDETEWAEIQYCSDHNDDIDVDCYNIEDTDYGLDPDLVEVAYGMVLEKLGYSFQIREDLTNNSQSEF